MVQDAVGTVTITNDASNEMIGVLGSTAAVWPHVIASRQTQA